MDVLRIVVTVIDALFMLLIIWVGATLEGKKNIGTCVAILVMMVLNLFCMWG